MLDELSQKRSIVEQQFKNLSDPNWVSQELKHLQGQYDVLNELINKGEQDASNNTATAPEDSVNNKSQQNVPRKAKRPLRTK